MIRSIDISTQVSPELSEILEAHVNNPDAIEDVTLGSVRAALAAGELGDRYDVDRLHPETGGGLLDELDALIDEYGGEALAIDFLRDTASEALSRVIEAVMAGAALPPSLGDVRDAMQGGLLARLVGEGAIEEDEDETLAQELEELIDRYGVDAPAEQFIHYE